MRRSSRPSGEDPLLGGAVRLVTVASRRDEHKAPIADGPGPTAVSTRPGLCKPLTCANVVALGLVEAIGQSAWAGVCNTPAFPLVSNPAPSFLGAPWCAKIRRDGGWLRTVVVGADAWGVRRGRPRIPCGACEPVGQHGGGGLPREPWIGASEPERQTSDFSPALPATDTGGVES